MHLLRIGLMAAAMAGPLTVMAQAENLGKDLSKSSTTPPKAPVPVPSPATSSGAAKPSPKPIVADKNPDSAVKKDSSTSTQTKTEGKDQTSAPKTEIKKPGDAPVTETKPGASKPGDPKVTAPLDTKPIKDTVAPAEASDIIKGTPLDSTSALKDTTKVVSPDVSIGTPATSTDTFESILKDLTPKSSSVASKVNSKPNDNTVTPKTEETKPKEEPKSDKPVEDPMDQIIGDGALKFPFFPFNVAGESDSATGETEKKESVSSNESPVEKPAPEPVNPSASAPQASGEQETPADGPANRSEELPPLPPSAPAPEPKPEPIVPVPPPVLAPIEPVAPPVPPPIVPRPPLGRLPGLSRAAVPATQAPIPPPPPPDVPAPISRAVDPALQAPNLPSLPQAPGQVPVSAPASAPASTVPAPLVDSTLPDAARTSEQKETPFVADMSLPPVEEKPDSLPAESPIKVIPATTATSEEQQNGSSGEAVSGGTIGAIIGSIVGVMLLVVAGFVWTRKKARLDANGQNDQEKGNPHDSMPESHFELYNGGHGSTCPITHVDDRLSTPSMPESSFEYRESILDPVPAPKAAGQTTWLSRLNIFGIGKKEEAEPSPPSSPSSSPFAETPVSFDMNALNSYKNTFADRYTVDLELPNVSDESWAAAQATTPVTPRHPETGEALAHRALHGLYSPMISPESSTARDSARVGDVRAYSDAYTTLPAAHQMAPSHRYEAKEGDLAHNQAILQSQVGDQNRQDEHPANQGNFYYDSRYKSGMSVQSYDSYL